MGDSPFRIVYLPVNMAWLVMFGDARLAGPFNDKRDAEDYLREISRAPECTDSIGRGTR